YDGLRSSAKGSSPHQWRDDEMVLVQHSSGTAARPKGCELTAKAVRAQLAMVTERLSFSESETIVSWLPLSHDMGLVGAVLLAFESGARLALGTPERFVLAPGTW